MAAPPLTVGVVQVTKTDALAKDAACTPVGAPGVVDGAPEAVVPDPLPDAFTAITVKL